MRQLTLITLLIFSISAYAENNSTDHTDRWQVYAYELLKRSITFRSVRGHKQVVPFAKYLAGEFAKHGFAAEDIQLLPMDSDGEPAAALVVRYRGTTKKKPILFAAHMDVVDATGEDWGRDPFTLTEEDGYFYGRGVLDDKLGTTVLTATFLRLKSEGFSPKRDLIIAFTGDEETQMWTIRSLVTDYRDLIDAEFAINLDIGAGRLNDEFEPIMYRLQFAEKPTLRSS